MITQTRSDLLSALSEIVSYDPGTGAEIGRAPQLSSAQVTTAIERARAAQPAWASLTFRERARYILQARKIVLAEIDEIATLISREAGKPVAEAISMEIVPALDLMHYFATHTAKLLRPQKINLGLYGLMGRTSKIVYKPCGVVGIISPWNFPWATPLDEVVMALMAGNAVALKPSELTPLTALKIADIFKRASLPDGLLSVLTGDGAVGSALIDAPVDQIMFTGSVATGKRVAAAAAKHLTRVVLELGGKDPMIVLEDANIENAVRGAVWGAFANSGQACASVERCYVHESIAPAFIERVVAETKALRQNLGTVAETDVGAMSSERQLNIVDEHVQDAVRRGAHLCTGGRRLPDFSGTFYEPTVLSEVDDTMQLMREETFGPVLPIMTFRTDAQAVALANNSIYGLTASVWTRDIARGKNLAAQIEAGTVMVNEVVYTHALAQTPWGGVKQSGYGTTHGRLGLLELVRPQHIHVNRLAFIPDVWWFGYSVPASRLFKGLANHFTTGSLLTSARLIPQIIRRFFEVRR